MGKGGKKSPSRVRALASPTKKGDDRAAISAARDLAKLSAQNRRLEEQAAELGRENTLLADGESHTRLQVPPDAHGSRGAGGGRAAGGRGTGAAVRC